MINGMVHALDHISQSLLFGSISEQSSQRETVLPWAECSSLHEIPSTVQDTLAQARYHALWFSLDVCSKDTSRCIAPQHRQDTARHQSPSRSPQTAQSCQPPQGPPGRGSPTPLVQGAQPHLPLQIRLTSLTLFQSPILPYHLCTSTVE